jgi:hypothetical protein
MTRAEQKALQARVAVRVLAQLAAKNEVKHQLRAQGLRIWDFTAKDIAIRVEAWLAVHPELIVEARAKLRGWVTANQAGQRRRFG